MAKDRMTKISESIKKGVSGDEGGMLSALWRDILIKDKFLPVIGYILDDYARRNKGKKVKNPNTVLDLVTAPKMTWKSFIFLLTKILPVKRITFTVELEYLSGKRGVHTISTEVKKNDREEKEFAEAIDELANTMYSFKNNNKKEQEEKDGGEKSKE